MLEGRDVKYAIRIPAKDSLERDIAKLLPPPVGRPSHRPIVWYKGFLYQAPVLADAAYGEDTRFRQGLSRHKLRYTVGVRGPTTVWPLGKTPLPAKHGKIGRPAKYLRRDKNHQPVSVRQLAQSLPPREWQTITWREGTQKKLRSRFAATRVRPAHRDFERNAPHPEQWLWIGWPKGESEPTKYWFSTEAADISRRELVKLAKHRWIIERDYEELKQELGLGHYEGRNGRGFYHHAALCIAAYGLLVAERGRFLPRHAPVDWGARRQEASVRVCTPRFAPRALSAIIPIPSPLSLSRSPGIFSNSCRAARFAAEGGGDL